MTTLYPRLPKPIADHLFERVSTLAPASEHPGQLFAPVGGHRAQPEEIEALAQRIRDLAAEFGSPEPLARGLRIEFDRRCAHLLVKEMDLSWSEAASHDVWSFMAIIALPDVTRWRFHSENRERWVATDLTRHVWARAWWRGTIFVARPDLLAALSESDLNQILERRVIGGDPRLTVALAEALVSATVSTPGDRRSLIRDCAARLRRRLAFIDARSLDDFAIAALCNSQIAESISLLSDSFNDSNIGE